MGLHFCHCHQAGWHWLRVQALFFPIVFRTDAVFPPLGDGKFLHIPLPLSMDRHKKKGQNRSSVLGGPMSPGDLSGRYQLGLCPCTGEKPPKRSKLSCSSGFEPECPGSRAFVLLTAQLETRHGEGQCPCLVPWHSDRSFERKRKEKGNFSLSTAGSCRVFCCSKDA